MSAGPCVDAAWRDALVVRCALALCVCDVRAVAKFQIASGPYILYVLSMCESVIMDRRVVTVDGCGGCVRARRRRRPEP